MRSFIHAIGATNGWFNRHQDANVAGMGELRADDPRYPRHLALPAQVKTATCQSGRPTCHALQRHSSCPARPPRSCGIRRMCCRLMPRSGRKSASSA